MRYLALAADYDGTLAHHGSVDEATLSALSKLRESGRKLLMVTGRELDELMTVFPHLDRFDRVVAENGALLYNPATKEHKVLCEPPPIAFVDALRARGVSNISVGKAIVATWEPYQVIVLETIQKLGLELHVIFNKGAVMVLPSGVNKATGLIEALTELGLSAHNAVGIGDAENDHTFLALCECAVAVSNALPSLKERADMVTERGHGAGVSELISRLVADDLADVAPRLARHNIVIGRREDGGEEHLNPYGSTLMVAGSSASGKSTLTTGVLDHLCSAKYQYVVIDPEGDYTNLEGAIVLGDAKRAPIIEELLDLLKTPGQNAVVNLLGVALDHRPAFFDGLLPRLLAHRTATGRPHWIVIDEAHHLLPSGWAPAGQTLPRKAGGLLFITVHPGSMATTAMEAVDLALVIGEKPEATLWAFCKTAGHDLPTVEPVELARGEALLWRRGGNLVTRVRTEPSKHERRRHSRKYAEGNLGPEHSFFFRGPAGKLNLKTHNLIMFLQIADGIDDDTWTFHLQRGDYSRWFKEGIKDHELAAAAVEIESQSGLTPLESRAAIRAEVERRYTLPADSASGIVDETSKEGSCRPAAAAMTSATPLAEGTSTG